jgi:hypothetical protein
MGSNGLAFARQNSIGCCLDVIPKRFPLVFFFPDIWPLKEWNGVSGLLRKNIHHRYITWLHNASPLLASQNDYVAS